MSDAAPELSILFLKCFELLLICDVVCVHFPGFIKFMESYYMILVTRRRQIGTICGHAIYSIEESQLITVPHPAVQTEISYSKVELRFGLLPLCNSPSNILILC